MAEAKRVVNDRDVIRLPVISYSHYQSQFVMSKEQKSNKEAKKKPLMTMKEKRSDKKTKKVKGKTVGEI